MDEWKVAKRVIFIMLEKKRKNFHLSNCVLSPDGENQQITFLTETAVRRAAGGESQVLKRQPGFSARFPNINKQQIQLQLC